MDNILYIIGQCFGILAVVLGFISFQQKTQLGIIVFQCATGFAFTAHYFLIGAMTAVVLNFLSALVCIVFGVRNKRNSKSKTETIICTLLIVVAGILSWDNIFSLLLIVGLAVNNISLSFSNPQHTRIAVFFKSPLCLSYNILVSSIGGVIFECAVLTSAIIGIIKNKSSKDSDIAS